MSSDTSDLLTELKSQIGSGGWTLLRAHAVSGSLILVDERIPLIEAALAIAEDRTELVSRWIAEETLHRKYPPADAEVSTVFNFVVVAPYVLAQPLSV